MALEITSTAFENGAEIPREYTCDGANMSPPLSWTGEPEGTRSLALIVNDPDAPRGTFTHWILFNIPPGVGGLPDNLPPDEQLDIGARQGMNDFGDVSYGGPCPPRGDHPHRYYFRLYALDTELALETNVRERDVMDAIVGHILDEGHLMGRYSRQEAQSAESR